MHCRLLALAQDLPIGLPEPPAGADPNLVYIVGMAGALAVLVLVVAVKPMVAAWTKRQEGKKRDKGARTLIIEAQEREVRDSKLGAIEAGVTTLVEWHSPEVVNDGASRTERFTWKSNAALEAMIRDLDAKMDALTQALTDHPVEQKLDALADGLTDLRESVAELWSKEE